MDNPVRDLVQVYEVRQLRKFSSLGSGKRILEVGCGTGNGSRLIVKYFRPKKIIATDLDSRMIKIARRKVKNALIDFLSMDATSLDFKSQSFDAVFDLGIMHHIPDWKKALREVRRVLKAGGQLIMEDLSLETFSSGIGRLMKVTLDHPYDKMYAEKEFLLYLKQLNFEISHYKITRLPLRYTTIVAVKR